MTVSTCLLFFLFVLCDLSRVFAASAFTNEKVVDQSETVVEFFKDHEVSEKQARENLLGMSESDFKRPAYCSDCTREHQRYCKSENLLKDHCCCNQSHKNEQLYFIPHTCFVNEERCSPSLVSCLTVMEIRNCCCDVQLKRHYEWLASIYSRRLSNQLSHGQFGVASNGDVRRSVTFSPCNSRRQSVIDHQSRLVIVDSPSIPINFRWKLFAPSKSKKTNCGFRYKSQGKSILAGASSSRSSKYLSMLLALLVARISL